MCPSFPWTPWRPGFSLRRVSGSRAASREFTRVWVRLLSGRLQTRPCSFSHTNGPRTIYTARYHSSSFYNVDTWIWDFLRFFLSNLKYPPIGRGFFLRKMGLSSFRLALIFFLLKTLKKEPDLWPVFQRNLNKIVPIIAKDFRKIM